MKKTLLFPLAMMCTRLFAGSVGGSDDDVLFFLAIAVIMGLFSLFLYSIPYLKEFLYTLLPESVSDRIEAAEEDIF